MQVWLAPKLAHLIRPAVRQSLLKPYSDFGGQGEVGFATARLLLIDSSLSSHHPSTA